MTSGDLPEIYPQYCFHLSSTIHRWCHFRAADVAALTTHPGFEGQDLYFHGNHPIKWIRVAGVIAAIDEYYSRRIYTIDDGSGVNIECITTIAMDKSLAGDTAALGNGSGTKGQIFGQKPQHTNTRIPNDLDVGLVVEVKGGVTTFRNVRQIKAESVKVLRSTRQEVEFWRRTTELRETVLAQPWTLRRRDIRRCRKEAEAEELASRQDEIEKRRKRARAKALTTPASDAAGDGTRKSKRTTGLEPVSRTTTCYNTSDRILSKRPTGLEPAGRTTAPSDAAPRPRKITGLESRIRHR